MGHGEEGEGDVMVDGVFGVGDEPIGGIESCF
jgi:hypothetical protein